MRSFTSLSSLRRPKGGKMLKQHFKVCFCFKRMFKLKAAEPPEEIKHIFNQYSENGIMNMDHLIKFVEEIQGEKHESKEHARAIFDSLKHLNIFQRRGLQIEAFFRYLLGNLNGPLSHANEVHHDMTAPLAHYFVFTGHNSYLTGNQFSSDSSTIPIIESLRTGVRVIELDLWPNSSGDGVEVRHGGTLTAPVELIDCLKAIKDHAFLKSEYPVIITFEDHINQRLQAKVAKMVTETFGELLFRPESQHTSEFPSPASLKRKILISTKPPEYTDSQIKSTKRNPLKLKELEEEEAENLEDKRDDQDEIEEDDDIYGYRNLISIHAGKPKGAIQRWLSSHSHVRRLSLSEQELEDIIQKHGTEIVRFTQRNLLRVYPKGTRLDSSNYNPMIAWMHGAQMVAFNIQGRGKYLRIMEGMFKANGGCGYIKKPDILLNEDEVFNPNQGISIKKILKVMVYMGEGWHADFGRTHFDLYSPPDFFVKVGIAGVPADTIMKRTKAIEDQWIPVWNDEFTFHLTVPELALLRIETLEYDTTGKHDFGGQTCLPISELRSGIRAVPLYSRRGEMYQNARLLMRFDFFDASETSELALPSFRAWEWASPLH
ncbi:hypothetical protein L6164_028652 [Bauhinia variegata]|uniref:Uncharacterized protein n=1 Tax=Bauhinia variegata TaxID=167791 RepID=A0ACB9L861_BAUVA|nr:hypothetical protein L6164_028652 [Bauhinia variegata]